MKSFSSSKCLLLSVLMISNGSYAQDGVPVLEGPYIGQNPPGLMPEVFAPDIVSKENNDWTGRFTPDMKEYYFTRHHEKSRKSTTVVFKLENDRWHESVLGPRMGGLFRLMVK